MSPRRLLLAAAIASTAASADPPAPALTFPADDVALPLNARPVFFGRSW